MSIPQTARPLRGTQLLVEHMGVVIRRPVLTLLEVGWRWLAGIPILCICWRQLDRMLAVYPLSASGLASVDPLNPWVAAVQLVGVWSYYQPHVVTVLRWLLPLAVLLWVVFSALGRNLVLMRLDAGKTPHLQQNPSSCPPGHFPQVAFSSRKSHPALSSAGQCNSDSALPFRPVTMMVFQAAWVALLALAVWGWFFALRWVAASHISAAGEPDLVGYFIWAIFLSLGFFTGFALVSWVLSIAPLLALLENRSVVSALGQSLRLGRPFTGKLAEINLVMGIVKLALIVLAMVFSAAPLPFIDELGGDALHFVWAGATVFYLVANDYFQVVRLQAFLEFWKLFRGRTAAGE